MALTRPRLGQINTTVSNFTDPIVVFNAGSTAANVDQGILFNRANGLVSNVALFFSESANSFVLGFTTNSGQTNSNIEISSNANLKVQGLFVENIFWGNGAQVYLDANLFNTLDANVGAFETYANTKIGTNSDSNLVVIAATESTSNVTGALVVQGGAGISGNVFANVLYTYQGIRWAGNGNVFASGGGGGGTFTASTTAPVVANDGDFWYNTTSDILLQYLDDGTNEYWVDTQSPVLFANTATTTVLGETTITGNLVPSANITYSLGTTTQRFKDLFLSGTTIDLGGATIKTDADSGAIALIPLPTTENPNPTGIVVSPAGTISTVETSGGTVSGNAISSSANNAVTTGTTTFGNVVVNDNLTAANLTANSNVTATKITTTTGVFWSNGVAFSSGLSTAQVNARVWAQKIFWG